MSKSEHILSLATSNHNLNQGVIIASSAKLFSETN